MGVVRNCGDRLRELRYSTPLMKMEININCKQYAGYSTARIELDGTVDLAEPIECNYHETPFQDFFEDCEWVHDHDVMQRSC